MEVKYSIILRVCAHVGIMLLVNGRINEQGILIYNDILKEYIEHTVD